MEGNSGSRLFLIMKDRVYLYCLYRIDAPGIDEDENTICQLDKPLYVFEKSLFPKRMSFTAVGSKIYMVGGYSSKGDIRIYPSNKTFIYDTLSNTLVDGPLLNGGKSCAHLFTIGSKIYALSDFLVPDGFKSGNMDPQPQFEVLDTEQVGGVWSPLPSPKLTVSGPRENYSIGACVGDATSGAIFIYVNKAGTYAFDLEKKLWSYISAENLLPLLGNPSVIPPSPECPSLCCSSALKSAFRLRYYSNSHDENNKVLKADRYVIENSPSKPSSLPPRTYHEISKTAFDRAGRVYYVTGGIDDFYCGTRFSGDRYVKVSVFDMCKEYRGLAFKNGEEKLEIGNEVKLGLNQGHILKKCNNKKREMGNREEDAEDETVKVELNQTQILTSCNKKKREMGDEDDETIKLKLTTLWRRCFFGGPICDMHLHITAAFAM